MGVKKKLQLTSLLGLSLLIMTACATNGTTSDITADSADFWSKFVVYQLENQKSHFRVGLSVSKKLGNAVTRNQIKRRIRHILLSVREQLADNVDFVVIARKGVEGLDYAEMEKNLLHVLKLSKIYQEGNGSEKETTVD